MYGVSSMSEKSITPNHPPSAACGGARELLINEYETTIAWLGMFAFLDLTEIVLVMMRADEICAAVM